MSQDNRPAGPGKPAYEKKSRSNRKVLYGILAIIAAAVVFGVAFLVGQSTRAGEEKPGSSASGTPTDGGSLRVGLSLEPTNLDVRKTAGVALDQVLIDNVYQGLVGLDATGDIVPVIASDYTQSDDGLTYTFTLNDDVVFHSGNALSVNDVVWSLTQVTENEDFRGNAELSDVTAITAVDDSTVEITLGQPNSQLLWSLAGRAGLILEEASDVDLATSANGTGPFVVDNWKQGDSLTLKRYNEYWGTPAKLDSIVFRYITDGNAALNAALNGDVDVQTAVFPNLVSQYDTRDDFDVVNADSSEVFTLAYNSGRAPLDNLAVRQAISQAIDTDALIESIEGAGKPLGSPIPSLDPGYTDLTKVNAYDPEHAKQLLAEAGQSNLTLTLTVPNHYEMTPINLLVSQLADVGITLNVQSVEFSTWLEQVYTNKDYDLSYVNHAEARDFGNYANPDYYFNYNNPAVDALYEDSLSATSDDQVDSKLAEASALVAADAPAKWLYNYTPPTAISTKVSGFPTSNTNARLNLVAATVS
ncbi:ABC transporter substrate-binding protein [Lysinibacter cavernae]|uniref:Peptide/nickel transport system substrate-binding protein n=1 Tax=Lysinibacter cavernae TaxID=1640652 RepID=A0A7X5TVF3_9MICO|nr:ABC transporter substrate-binding protein [Lysinibacter cavernae]NIH54967.1 peptide/nickel transport system substrate-binding protein [Lysinibacter cavernae]